MYTNKQYNIKSEYVCKLGFLYLAIPELLFVLTFLKRGWSVLAGLAILISLFFVLEIRVFDSKAILGKDNESTKGVRAVKPEALVAGGVPVKLLDLLLLAIICILWCYLGGQGGFFFQTSDWNERNAILRDLIEWGWPVYYETTDTFLVYYIAQWLPAAAVGKFVLHFTGLSSLAWTIANLTLWFWTALGCYLTLLLFMLFVKIQSRKAFYAVVWIMVFFSGLDLAGCVLTNWVNRDMLTFLHIEWWIQFLEFSSNTTCLFWVYNQAIPAWIATLCFLHETSCKNYIFIFTCALLAAPMPCVGLCALMIVQGVVDLVQSIKAQALGFFLKNVFSIPNVLMLLGVMPFLACYFLMNQIVGEAEGKNHVNLPTGRKVYFLLGVLLLAGGFYLFLVWKRQSQKKVQKMVGGMIAIIIAFLVTFKLYPELSFNFLLFLFLEVGIYLLFLYPSNYDKPMYYGIACTFIVAPAIRIGIGYDFCMRATIPALIVLMVYVTKELMCMNQDVKKPREGDLFCDSKYSGLIQKICAWGLIIALIIGSATPCVEMYRGVKRSVEAGTVMLVADEIGTLNRFRPDGQLYWNFVSSSYRDTFFYQHMMRIEE